MKMVNAVCKFINYSHDDFFRIACFLVLQNMLKWP